MLDEFQKSRKMRYLQQKKALNPVISKLSSVLCVFVLAHLSRRLKGELIVYQSSRRLSLCVAVCLSVNIFTLEYLHNQWANRNQILSEASLGWGIDCIRFGPGRIGTLVSMATNSSHRVIMGEML